LSSARREWVWLVLALAAFGVVAFWIVLNTSSNEKIEPPYSTYT